MNHAPGPLTATPPGAARSQPPLDRLPHLLRKIRSVPDEVRRFSVTAVGARATHRLEADLLDTLVAEGLPCAGTGGSRLFDDYDLGNVALHLGLMSVRRMAIRSWTHALQRNSARECSHARVSFVPRCPVPGHPGPCRFAILEPGGQRRAREGPGDGTEPAAEHEITLPGSWPVIGPRARELVADLADVEFFLLPEVIRWDPEFLLRARIADCGGAADWLVREGRRRDLAVRFSFGLLVTSPYSTPHCWAEFRADGVWVPVDPVLLKAMHSLAPQHWPAHRSTGAIMSRLGSRFTKLASHGGFWSALSLPTEYLP